MSDAKDLLRQVLRHHEGEMTHGLAVEIHEFLEDGAAEHVQGIPTIGGTRTLEVRITDEGVTIDAFDEEGEPAGTIAMDFDEWWEYAKDFPRKQRDYRKARAFERIHTLLNEPGNDWSPGSDMLDAIAEQVDPLMEIRDEGDHENFCLRAAEKQQDDPDDDRIPQCVCRPVERVS